MRRIISTKRLSLILIIIFSTIIFNQRFYKSSFEKYEPGENLFTRKLLNENQFIGTKNVSANVFAANCTEPAIENFPKIPESIRKSVLFSLLCVLIIVYLFIGTGIICDRYFVPSLEIICDKLSLEPDIAGSTFMAAGSSAPELATALIGVTVTKDDIGIGTVVGSAVFNIAFVISICALFAGRVIHINCWPIFRDSVFYLISICLLFVVMFDKKISLLESISFLFIYLVYILFMAFNKQIEAKLGPKLSKLLRLKYEMSSNCVSYDVISDNTSSDEINGDLVSDVDCIQINGETNEDTNLSQILRRQSTKHFKFLNILWNYLISPLKLIYWLTVTDCTQEKRKNWFAITFAMSCLWISLYSYLIVWMITIIGFNLHIPDTVMGLIFIAGGASIPDAVSSLIVVRQGLGDMALTNAIASNVFDILICLGLPWLLQTAIINPGSEIDVISRGLEYSTLSLLSTVIFFILATHLNGWKLTQKYGIILMVWYFSFISFASLYELNVFGQLNPPMCRN